MRLGDRPPLWFVWLILTIGSFAASTAAIFVRLISLSADKSGIGFSLFIAASRLTFAALVLVPAWQKIPWQTLQPGALPYAGAAGLCLAFHFATWITSLSYTSIAEAITLVTTTPIWVALLSRLFFKEKLSKQAIAGISIALAGGLTIALADMNSSSVASNSLLGNFLALIGAWTFSVYILLAREAQVRGLGISSYIAIAYSVAAVVLLPMPLIFGVGYSGYPSLVYVYLLLIALLPQLVGHTSLNWAVHWMSPTIVTLVSLFEPVWASFSAFLLFAELPSPMVLVGAVVLLIGVAIAALGTRQ